MSQLGTSSANSQPYTENSIQNSLREPDIASRRNTSVEKPVDRIEVFQIECLLRRRRLGFDPENSQCKGGRSDDGQFIRT